MDVAIFGAGVSGLMSAIALRPMGHRSRIYERAPRDHQAGMGFILVPECIQGLQGLGVTLKGVELDCYLFRDSSGRILNQQTMPAGSRGIRRGELIAALVDTLRPDQSLAFNSQLTQLDINQEGRVTAAQVASAEGSFTVQADVYIAADGIGSRGREALFPGWPLAQAQVPEVVGLVRSPEAVRWADHHFNKFHARDGGVAVGVLPVDTEHVIWFLQFDSQRYPAPQEHPDLLRDFVQWMVSDWGDPIPHLLVSTDFSRAHLWRPVDVDLIPSFSRGNLALVGDAAHPLLPFTSQGVASGVADAIALADTLTSQNNLAEALANYSTQRRRECAPYVAKGRELMKHFLEPLGTLTELPIA